VKMKNRLTRTRLLVPFKQFVRQPDQFPASLALRLCRFEIVERAFRPLLRLLLRVLIAALV